MRIQIFYHVFGWGYDINKFQESVNNYLIRLENNNFKVINFIATGTKTELVYTIIYEKIKEND